MNCKNCSQELTGTNKYCSNCGQKNIGKLTLKYIFSQFIEDVFNVDSKVFRTLKFLIIKPGFISKDYIQGKRTSYVPPVRLYIVMSVLFFFVASIIEFEGDSQSKSITIGAPDGEERKIDGVDFTVNGENVIIPTEEFKKMQYEGRLEEGLDSLTAEMPSFAGYVSRKLAKSRINNEGFQDVLADQFSLFLLLFLPFFSLMYSTVFSGSKKGFVGNLIFNLHLNSFIIFSLLVFMFVNLLIGGNEYIEIAWFGVVMLYGQFYLIRAVMTFYERKLWIAIYKYLLLLFGYAVLTVVFFLAVLFSSMVVI